MGVERVANVARQGRLRWFDNLECKKRMNGCLLVVEMCTVTDARGRGKEDLERMYLTGLEVVLIDKRWIEMLLEVWLL